MPGWGMKIIAAEAERLLALSAEDADLRADLRALAEAILSATEPPRSDPAPAIPDVASAGPGRDAEPLHELTLGRPRPSPPLLPSSASHPIPADAALPEIEARCRGKTEAARQAATRLRRMGEGGGVEAEGDPSTPEVAVWADTFADWFCWSNASEAAGPVALVALDQLAGCFEAMACAVSFAAEVENRRGAAERALPLLAEAQSALRAAVRALHGEDDPDQVRAFEWLKTTAARHHVYIGRFMRADDAADPASWPGLLDRIAKEAGRSRPGRPREARIERVRSRLGPIREGRGTDRDWDEVIEAVETLVREGVPPSSREVRDLLMPVVDDLPDRDDLPHGFRLVLREIDRVLAARTPPMAPPSPPGPTAEVAEARRLLGGRAAVLIGGARRRDAQKALEATLGLRGLTWIETKEHQSIGTFEAAISRADVALVLLAIRWSSHAFGDVKRFCDRHGKPLVRLPGGYGPNQVASQILAQCRDRLSTGAGPVAGD